MGLEQIRVLEQVASLEILSEELAKLQRTIRYLLNGNLDFMNIRAKGITAENIDVDKLSAIVADIGEVTAGIIRGVEIYGSYIATSEGGFPRTEMSTEDNHFKVWLNETTFIEVIYAGDDGLPQIRLVKDGDFVNMGYGATLGNPYPGIYSTSPFIIYANGGFFPAGIVQFSNWSNVFDNATGRDLQQELDDIRDQIDTLTATMNAKAEKGASTSSSGSHNHGIPDGTQLMTTTGTVTWSSAGAHSHA